MDATHVMADDARVQMHPSASEQGTSGSATVLLRSGVHEECKGNVKGGRRRQERRDGMEMEVHAK